MGICLKPHDVNKYDALTALLHSADAFAHPRDVIRDTDLTINEKRAILAYWASDACAVESEPSLRALSVTSKPVTFDEVMDALRHLDEKARASARPTPPYRRVLALRGHSVPRPSGRLRTE